MKIFRSILAVVAVGCGVAIIVCFVQLVLWIPELMHAALSPSTYPGWPKPAVTRLVGKDNKGKLLWEQNISFAYPYGGNPFAMGGPDSAWWQQSPQLYVLKTKYYDRGRLVRESVKWRPNELIIKKLKGKKDLSDMVVTETVYKKDGSSSTRHLQVDGSWRQESAQPNRTKDPHSGSFSLILE